MDILKIMQGAVDLHVHCGPDAFSVRRVDALELASQANSAGMNGVVIKSHHFCTAPLAAMVNKIVNKSILIGSLVLNRPVGGLNPEGVRAAAKAGAKIVWMPTFSSREEQEAKKNKSAIIENNNQDPGIWVVDEKGRLVSEVLNILSIIKDTNMILATGHISMPETLILVDEALKQDIKVIITHPFAKPIGESLTVKEAQPLVQRGAYIEFCYNDCMPVTRISPVEVVKIIKILGPEHCLLTTDFGQIHHPEPTEGFRMMVASMARYGLSENELEILVKANPAKLLS
jgi:hypothetical protein